MKSKIVDIRKQECKQFDIDVWLKDQKIWMDKINEDKKTGGVDFNSLTTGTMIILDAYEKYICVIMATDRGRISWNKSIVMLSVNEHMKAVFMEVSSMMMSKKAGLIAESDIEKHTITLNEKTTFLVEQQRLLMQLIESVIRNADMVIS